MLRQSYDILQKAERRIELLSGVDAEGNPITEPFDDTATTTRKEGEPGESRRRFQAAAEAEKRRSSGLELGLDGVGRLYTG